MPKIFSRLTSQTIQHILQQTIHISTGHGHTCQYDYSQPTNTNQRHLHHWPQAQLTAIRRDIQFSIKITWFTNAIQIKPLICSLHEWSVRCEYPPTSNSTDFCRIYLLSNRSLQQLLEIRLPRGRLLLWPNTYYLHRIHSTNYNHCRSHHYYREKVDR